MISLKMKCDRAFVAAMLTMLSMALTAASPAFAEKAEMDEPKALSNAAASELQSKIIRKSTDFKSRIRLAEHFLATKSPQKAIETLRPVSDVLPRKGLLLLAHGYAGTKSYLNEVRTLEMLLAKNPKDYYVQYQLGLAYTHINKSEEAITNFRAAIATNAKFEPAYQALLKEYKKTDNNYEARNLISDMTRIFGNKPQFLSSLCRLYSEEGYSDKSIEACKTAIAKQPKFAENHVYLGLAMKDKERMPEASKILKQAAKSFPRSEMAQWAAGQITLEEKNFLGSYKYFRQGAILDPDSARSQLGLGMAAIEIQNYADSLKGYSAACMLDRGTILEFRRALARLRRENVRVWPERFDTAISKCEMLGEIKPLQAN